MNHVIHALILVLKACQNPNTGDDQLAVRHPSHQSKKVRHRFQHSDHMVLQFSGFAFASFSRVGAISLIN